MRPSFGASSVTSASPGSRAPARPDPGRLETLVVAAVEWALTAASDGNDPEAFAEAYARRLADLEAIVETHGGRAVPGPGGPLIAIWGLPVPEEGDARRAVSAAREILAWTASHPGGPSARAVVDIGPVVICPSRTGLDVPDLGRIALLGPVIESCRRRLLELPHPALFVSTPVRDLIHRDFDFSDPVAVPAPLGSLWREIVGRREEPGRIGRAPRGAIVGREREIAALRDFLADLSAGRAPCLAIAGVAGIGKSALVEVLHEDAEARAIPVLRLQCLPEKTSTPLFPLQSLVPLLHARKGSPAPANAQSRTGIFEILLSALRARASSEGLLVAVEDIQHADETTLAFLFWLSTSLPAPQRFGLVVTRRDPTVLSAAHTEGYRELRLGKLDRDSLEAALRVRFGPGEPSDTVFAEIAERAEGIPFYAIELGHLAREGRYAPRSSFFAPSGSLAQTLSARIAALGPDRTVVEAASAFGSVVREAPLARLLGLSARALRSRLEALTRRGIFEQKGQGRASVFVFSHSLLRDAAQSALLADRRRQLHGAIADGLISGFPEIAGNEPECLARHLVESGRYGEALPWLRKAAQNAIRLSSASEAVVLLKRWLATELIARAASRREIVEIHDLLGAQLGALLGHAAPPVVHIFERSRRLATGEPAGEEISFDLDFGLACARLLSGDVAGALAVTGPMLERATLSGREGELIVAERLEGLGALLAGDIAGARHHLCHAVEIYDENRHGALKYRFLSDQGSLASCHLAWCEALAGDVEAAERHASRALALSRRHDHPHTSAHVFAVLALAGRDLKSPDDAITLAERAKDLAHKHGFHYWTAFSSMALGLLGAARDPRRSLDRLTDGVRAFEQLRAGQALAVAKSELAACRLALGDVAGAVAGIAAAEATLGVGRVNIYAADVLRSKATILARSGASPADAEFALRRGLELAQRQGAGAHARRLIAAAVDIAAARNS